jgi:hypothetical protein
MNRIFVIKMLRFVSDFDFSGEFGGFHGMNSRAGCLLEQELGFSEGADEREIDSCGGHRRDWSGAMVVHFLLDSRELVAVLFHGVRVLLAERIELEFGGDTFDV